MLKKICFAALICLISKASFATKEYDACYKTAQTDDEVALCMKAETARLIKDIQSIYLTLSTHDQTKAWNNGNGLSSGNLKDMYNHWIAYRNRYCYLFQKASENVFGTPDFHKERCLLNLTTDHLDLMRAVLINANTGSEESDLDYE